MKDSTNRAFVYVKVSPALRAYVIAVNNGSDTILPARQSRLWGLVKQHLELVPTDYKPMPVDEDPDYIRIALYSSRRRSWSIPTGRTIVVDTMYRDYLSDEGQRAVAKYLMSEFKSVFRAYMTGALSNNPELTIRDAIDEFCSDYSIDTDKVTFEMLCKDWYRFRMRCGKSQSIPMENTDL
ncbi:MAG: hypothetical protein ACI3ZQ_04920 [Candidatus Cryptobacteroides sp.]